jgi:hypothetical protein
MLQLIYALKKHLPSPGFHLNARYYSSNIFEKKIGKMANFILKNQFNF